jgi:hypothetical protein
MSLGWLVVASLRLLMLVKWTKTKMMKMKTRKVKKE